MIHIIRFTLVKNKITSAATNVQSICLKTSLIDYDRFQVCTILVLNYHHRLASNHRMPFWFRSIFLQWLPWLLRMSRPGAKITRKTIYLQNKVSCNVNLDFLNPISISFKIIRFYSNNIYNLFFQMRELEQGDKNSKSLLANVLDLEVIKSLKQVIIMPFSWYCFLSRVTSSLFMIMSLFFNGNFVGIRQKLWLISAFVY